MGAERPLLHVGMAKAASTFLQNELFCSLEGVHYLGKLHVADDLDRARRAIVRATSLTWDEADVAAVFERELAEAARSGKRPVLSDEDFSVFKFLDPATSVGRVRAILGPLDILLMIRHPLSWLRSNYLFRLSTLEPRAVLGFGEWFEIHSEVVGIGSDITEIRFAELAEVYRRVAGGRMTVVPMELITLDRAAFAATLAEAIGASSDEVAARLDAPPDRRRHKIGMSIVEQEMLETARWVVLRQLSELRPAQDRLADAYGLALPADCASLRDELVEGGVHDLHKWRPFYRDWKRANAAIIAEHPKACPELDKAQRQRVTRILKRQLAWLGADLETPLPGYPVVYGRDDARAADRPAAGNGDV